MPKRTVLPLGAVTAGTRREIEMDISFWGYLSDEQRERLLQIARKCPVHHILASSIPIRAKLASENTSTPMKRLW